LRLTQQELGDMVGCTKRTIQRWEDRGAMLLPSQAQALATALRRLQPDLSVQIAASMGMTIDQLVEYRADSSAPPAIDPIESIVHAAAEAMGITPDAARPGVAAAFERAQELRVNVNLVTQSLIPLDEEG
jgi:transcriptional regulator with XRE-family HTH domain